MFVNLSEGYRRAFKRGMRGWDVAVLQLNLTIVGGYPLALDGDFGAKTEAAVKDYQDQHRLEVDGIAGLRTQMSIMLVASTLAQADYSTPKGLLRGLMEGESGWAIAATSRRYANGSRDVGGYQENLSANELESEAAVRDAFSVNKAARRTAARLRNMKNSFYGQPGANTHEAAWSCAILNHNWPAAAARIANGTSGSWEYRARWYPNVAGADNGRVIAYHDDGSQTRAYKMTNSAQWISRIGVPGVTTGYQWADHYVQTKAIYVKEWTV